MKQDRRLTAHLSVRKGAGVSVSETKPGGNWTAEDAASAFGAMLDVLSRTISPALIDDVGWRRLRSVAEGLPVDPGAGFGFELRLGEAAGRSDFYAAIPRRSILADHYIRRGREAAPDSAAAAFADSLAAIDTDAPWAGLICVEYDAASAAADAQPGLFVRIPSDSAATGASEVPTAKTVAEWLAGAVGWRLTHRECRTINLAFDSMETAGAPVDCLGVMPGRPGRLFKVNSCALDPARAPSVLERLGWRGPIGEVAEVLSAFDGLFRALRLAVGVSAEGVLPRIGLELFQTDPAAVGRPGIGKWMPFVARLCERGLCLPDKMEGLSTLPETEFVFYERGTVGILTSITHIKLSFEERQEGGAIEAKAYPGSGYLPFDMIHSHFASR